MNKNPIVVPTILHIIIPCIILVINDYNINIIIPSVLSFIRVIVTFFKCETIELNKYLVYFVLLLDFSVTCIYIVLSIILHDAIVATFSVIYLLGFIWICLALRENKIESEENNIIICIIKDTECCICCDILKDVDEIRILSCKHIYHKECIEKWFKEKKICPYCRRIPNDE